MRDPGLENMAMGGKLIWQLYADKNNSASKIFRMKYLKGGSLRNLKYSNTPSGTAVQNSFRKGIDNFNRQLYRIPRNGKRILLWDGNILWNPPLSSVLSLEEIKNWTINKGLLRLVDIFLGTELGIGLIGCYKENFLCLGVYHNRQRNHRNQSLSNMQEK